MKALLILAACSSLAQAKAKPPPLPSLVDVRLVDGGQFAEVRADGAKLTVRSTATGAASARTLTDAERARLTEAARAALAQDDVRRSCGGVGEVFVTVTVDDKTLFNAVCDTAPDAMVSAWRHVIVVARAIAQAK